MPLGLRNVSSEHYFRIAGANLSFVQQSFQIKGQLYIQVPSAYFVLSMLYKFNIQMWTHHLFPNFLLLLNSVSLRAATIYATMHVKLSVALTSSLFHHLHFHQQGRSILTPKYSPYKWPPLHLIVTALVDAFTLVLRYCPSLCYFPLTNHYSAFMMTFLKHKSDHTSFAKNLWPHTNSRIWPLCSFATISFMRPNVGTSHTGTTHSCGTTTLQIIFLLWGQRHRTKHSPDSLVMNNQVTVLYPYWT